MTAQKARFDATWGRNSQLDLLVSRPLWLRDACDCPRCVDQSTRQKLFQTCDIPLNIKANVIEESDDAFKVLWQNDLATAGSEHISVYDKDTLSTYLKPKVGKDGATATGPPSPTVQLWDGASMARGLLTTDYASYCDSQHAVLKVLGHLKRYGLVLITGVPSQEDAVETIARKVGHLRETFYGRTWDVKSVPQAKNVAYTNQSLGFHMDLLYMSDPPGLQLLHCLQNTCHGGESLFADAFRAAQAVTDTSKDNYRILSTYAQTFRYKNAGEHYHFTRPIVTSDSDGGIEYVNWSPPFQGPFEARNAIPSDFHNYVRAAKAFSSHVEAPPSIFEYRVREGDCFIFNNRRVLHARRAFDTTSGERWLKGAYLDTDVFNSRLRVLQEKLGKL